MILVPEFIDTTSILTLLDEMRRIFTIGSGDTRLKT